MPTFGTFLAPHLLPTQHHAIQWLYLSVLAGASDLRRWGILAKFPITIRSKFADCELCFGVFLNLLSMTNTTIFPFRQLMHYDCILFTYIYPNLKRWTESDRSRRSMVISTIFLFWLGSSSSSCPCEPFTSHKSFSVLRYINIILFWTSSWFPAEISGTTFFSKASNPGRAPI